MWGIFGILQFNTNQFIYKLLNYHNHSWISSTTITFLFFSSSAKFVCFRFTRFTSFGFIGLKLIYFTRVSLNLKLFTSFIPFFEIGEIIIGLNPPLIGLFKYPLESTLSKYF